ncbi:ACP phosphodiesterase [Pseudoxanthomonas koreensis]|uniref:acyl carrier protein phosphodiesterase n=1 Tax=Pseudoxanthomonas koreensis TaxID=266061 RepID=UPI0035A7166E
MNYLAHLYLAGPGHPAMLGALLGDFVFGRLALQDYPAQVRREIVIHRRVDRYTDTHPLVVQARGLFAPELRRYAGIALDVYYDHCLARAWDRYSQVPLDAFTAPFYAWLLQHLDGLPQRLRAIAPLMAGHDWLGSYRQRHNVDRAVARIATRLSRNGERLVACLDDLARHEAAIAAGFEAFFPQLQDYVAQLRPSLEASEGGL